jgi:Tfp pilus assembly protein PilV
MLTMAPNKQSGLTLIELMISIALGLLVLTGLVYMLSATMRTNTSTIRTTHLNQELRAIMDLMTRDLKRAGALGHAEEGVGFAHAHCLTVTGTTVTAQPLPCASGAPDTDFDSWINAGTVIRHQRKSLQADGSFLITNYDATVSANNTSSLTLTANPFPSDSLGAGSWTWANPFSTTTILTTTNPTSITYSYDTVQSGDSVPNGILDCNELFGFRYDATNKAIESVIGENSGGTCTRASWQDLSDPESIEIDAFTITAGPLIGVVLSTVIREYTITLTGHLKSDSTVTRTIEEVVRVRNDPVL